MAQRKISKSLKTWTKRFKLVWKYREKMEGMVVRVEEGSVGRHGAIEAHRHRSWPERQPMVGRTRRRRRWLKRQLMVGQMIVKSGRVRGFSSFISR
ncbi:CPBP family intramembrane metalloprotease [Sesbania bispinosa]|nr:CPBP family intramembrane metalloprotease [Sesbania bispinosa]